MAHHTPPTPQELKNNIVNFNSVICASDMNVEITPIEQPHSQPCDYCHSITINDSRGNCCACGAPRRAKYPSGFLTVSGGLTSDDLEAALKLTFGT